MWIEKKGDLIVIGQGMGKGAYLFYDRFWGFIAKADTPTAEQVANNGDICVITLTLSHQAKETQIKRLISAYCGTAWGKIQYETKWVNKDWVGLPKRLDLVEVN